MKKDCVVVIRIKGGDDILAIIIGEQEGIIRIEHPYYARYEIETDSISILPYCPLSSNSYFEFNRSEVEFVVPAAADVTMKFLNLLASIETIKSIQRYDDFSSDVKETRITKSRSSQSRKKKSFVIKGNETKH